MRAHHAKEGSVAADMRQRQPNAGAVVLSLALPRFFPTRRLASGLPRIIAKKLKAMDLAELGNDQSFLIASKRQQDVQNQPLFWK